MWRNSKMNYDFCFSTLIATELSDYEVKIIEKRKKRPWHLQIKLCLKLLTWDPRKKIQSGNLKIAELVVTTYTFHPNLYLILDVPNVGSLCILKYILVTLRKCPQNKYIKHTLNKRRERKTTWLILEIYCHLQIMLRTWTE